MGKVKYQINMMEWLVKLRNIWNDIQILYLYIFYINIIVIY
mgnify:CR=1 FL=1|jgi:hypothetical protein